MLVRLSLIVDVLVVVIVVRVYFKVNFMCSAAAAVAQFDCLFIYSNQQRNERFFWQTAESSGRKISY